MPSITGGLFGDIQELANRIQRDIENQLNRAFRTFEVLEHEALNDPEHTSYRMKMLTDDNGHVRVKTVKKDPGSDWETHIEEYDRGNRAIEQGRRSNAAGLEQGRSNLALEQGRGNHGAVEQSRDNRAIEQPTNSQPIQQNRGNPAVEQGSPNTMPTNPSTTLATRPEERMIPSSRRVRSLFDDFFDDRMDRLANRFEDRLMLPSRRLFDDFFDDRMVLPSRRLFDDDFFDNRIQSLANIIRSDVERQLDRTFRMFDVLEHEALKDPEHTSYYMKVKTDDNGHVRVKTVRKEPGKGWETHVEEYDRGRAIDQGNSARNTAAIKNNDNNSNNITNSCSSSSMPVTNSSNCRFDRKNSGLSMSNANKSQPVA